MAVFVAPLLSEARYHAYLNNFAAVIAKEYYFSSNYLKEGGAAYLMNGWNGLSVEMDEIQIRNYDNTLLTNQTGQDLDYIFSWEIKVYNSSGVELKLSEPYTLEVRYKDGTTSAGEDKRAPEITYGADRTTGSARCKIYGDGNSKRDIYTIYLKAPAIYQNKDQKLDNDSYAIITYTATNAGSDENVSGDRNQYSRKITSKITYNVSTLEDFIKVFDISDSDDTLTAEIATNTIPGSGNVQKVYMWWDTAVLKVNRFNHQFNQLFLEGKYQTKTVGERTFGVLEISASSSSSRIFQYDKLDTTVSFEDKTHMLEGESYTEAGNAHYIGYFIEDVAPEQNT